MKDLCKYCCFWKKICNSKTIPLMPIETNKSNIANSDSNKVKYEPIKIENNLKMQQISSPYSSSSSENSAIEMSNSLGINEDIIFPLKYLNENEASSSFNFEFSKNNIISYLENEIINNTDYKSLVNKNGFDIYIKESGGVFNSSFPMIKMFYKIPKSDFTCKNISVELIDEYMNNPEKRLKWDKSIREYKIIERENKEVYLLHYICKSPMIFVSERDVVDKRYDFYVDNIYYDFSSSVKDDYIPIEEGVMRITDHCSLCKMFENNDEFNIISITQVDTKFSLPPAMMSVQLPIKYKEWYDSLVNEINESETKIGIDAHEETKMTEAQ